jgi:hypothetical protein
MYLTVIGERSLGPIMISMIRERGPLGRLFKRAAQQPHGLHSQTAAARRRLICRSRDEPAVGFAMFYPWPSADFLSSKENGRLDLCGWTRLLIPGQAPPFVPRFRNFENVKA